MFEEASTHTAPHFISEAEFIKLCRDVYADRHQIYEFNPSVGKREALLWMLTGCLISLLSVPLLEQSFACGDTTEDPYGDAVREILHGRMRPPFDPQIQLTELSDKISSEE